jgi:hypothetical protein
MTLTYLLHQTSSTVHPSLKYLHALSYQAHVTGITQRIHVLTQFLQEGLLQQPVWQMGPSDSTYKPSPLKNGLHTNTVYLSSLACILHVVMLEISARLPVTTIFIHPICAALLSIPVFREVKYPLSLLGLLPYLQSAFVLSADSFCLS